MTLTLELMSTRNLVISIVITCIEEATARDTSHYECLGGEFRTKGADDAVSGNLGLDLDEPNFGIGGPEGWYLDGDGCGGDSMGSGLVSGVIFNERHREGRVTSHQCKEKWFSVLLL